MFEARINHRFVTSDKPLHASVELTYCTARGMSELGDYGMIIGDPLLALVTPVIPESRGYAVQVIVQTLFFLGVLMLIDYLVFCR